LASRAADGRGTQIAGFVAMEYFAAILNRTFVIFIAPEGLYGWKAVGPVIGWNPLYFEPYAKMLDDPKLMQDLTAVRKLSLRRGGFFIPRSEIVSIEAIHKAKWGMGGIPHSGKILIRLVSGSQREFVALGNVELDQIKRSIT
jgi:hypothetical protein